MYIYVYIYIYIYIYIYLYIFIYIYTYTYIYIYTYTYITLQVVKRQCHKKKKISGKSCRGIQHCQAEFWYPGHVIVARVCSQCTSFVSKSFYVEPFGIFSRSASTSHRWSHNTAELQRTAHTAPRQYFFKCVTRHNQCCAGFSKQDLAHNPNLPFEKKFAPPELTAVAKCTGGIQKTREQA